MGTISKVTCNPTLNDILHAVQENGGILESYGYGFTCPTGIELEVGGWQICLVNTQGMGNHGSYIAVAMNQENFLIQEYYTKKRLRRLADEAEKQGKIDDRGDFALTIVPLVHSSLYRRGGTFMFKDEKWAYFHHTNANFVRIGDGRDRLWVKPVYNGPKPLKKVEVDVEPIKKLVEDRPEDQQTQQEATSNWFFKAVEKSKTTNKMVVAGM